MTLRNPNANESVEDYDKLQTAEINANTSKIDDNTTKIGSDTLVGSILYRLGLIKDYVVEYGTISGWDYEKMASGKISLTMLHNTTATFSNLDSGWFRTQTLSANLPTNLLKKLDYVPTPSPSGSSAFGSYLQLANLTKVDYRLYRVAGGLSDVPVSTYIKVEGKWKI